MSRDSGQHHGGQPHSQGCKPRSRAGSLALGGGRAGFQPRCSGVGHHLRTQGPSASYWVWMWSPSSQLPVHCLSTAPHSPCLLGAGHLPGAGPLWGSRDAIPPVLSMSQLRLRVETRLGQDHTAVVNDSRGTSNPAASEGPALGRTGRGPGRWKVRLLSC